MRYFVASILLVLSFNCADPFSSRGSLPPTTDLGTFVQPVSPHLVLFNLQSAYQELIVVNFNRCLDSNFIFTYDFITNQLDEFDTGWSFSEELRITESMFNNIRSDSSVSINLLQQNLIDRQDQSFGDSAILYRSYTLTIVSSNYQSSPDTAVFQGSSTFTMTENQQGLWKIVLWEDRHQTTGIPSWADYKNGFR